MSTPPGQFSVLICYCNHNMNEPALLLMVELRLTHLLSFIVEEGRHLRVKLFYLILLLFDGTKACLMPTT